jgi:chromosome segregation ATPase
MERAQRELVDAQETIRRLEQQLMELQLAKKALEDKEGELLQLTRQLQSERDMSQEERDRLEAEIVERERQVLYIYSLY